MIVSFLLYLLASLIDPGFLPKQDPQEIAMQASLTSEGKVSYPDLCLSSCVLHEIVCAVLMILLSSNVRQQKLLTLCWEGKGCVRQSLLWGGGGALGDV